MPTLRQIIDAFLGRRVRIWTRFIEEPEEGIMIFLHLKQPFIILIRTDDKKYKIYNLKEVVRIDCLEEIRI
jgi:hypothetical protein